MKYISGIVMAGFALTAIAALYFVYQLATIGTSYTAKILCSGIFVSQRDPRSILDVDLGADDLALLRHTDVNIDFESREVMASWSGIAKRKAVYRRGNGCMLDYGISGIPQHQNNTPNPLHESVVAIDESSPVVDLPEEIDRQHLDTVLRWAFAEPDSKLPRRTRAVVIVYKNRVVAEKYAEGITKDTPLPGWSMTKTVINALVGVLVGEGRIALEESIPIPEWQDTDDPRRKITWDHLLRMTSGLQFNEDQSNPLSDVTEMLLGAQDMAAYAAAKPLVAEPGALWNYSSGNTNIIAYAIRQVIGNLSYPEFPHRTLFDKLGMTGALIETDASGTFVGSSFMYATARDWARVGQLYLNNGKWIEQKILPEDWVTYTRSPTLSSPEQQYGANVWLKIPEHYRCSGLGTALPSDAFHAIGHEGQFVTIIPSKDLVLVRLGLTRYPCAWDHQQFVSMVLESIMGAVQVTSPE